MERYRFGKGDYKYFRYPLPEVVEQLRTATYPHLAKLRIAGRPNWARPKSHFRRITKQFLDRCHRAGKNSQLRSCSTTKPWLQLSSSGFIR